MFVKRTITIFSLTTSIHSVRFHYPSQANCHSVKIRNTANKSLIDSSIHRNRLLNSVKFVTFKKHSSVTIIISQKKIRKDYRRYIIMTREQTYNHIFVLSNILLKLNQMIFQNTKPNKEKNRFLDNGFRSRLFFYSISRLAKFSVSDL